MARNYEQHPLSEALYDFGVIALVIGSLAIIAAGVEVLGQ